MHKYLKYYDDDEEYEYKKKLTFLKKSFIPVYNIFFAIKNIGGGKVKIKNNNFSASNFRGFVKYKKRKNIDNNSKIRRAYPPLPASYYMPYTLKYKNKKHENEFTGIKFNL